MKIRPTATKIEIASRTMPGVFAPPIYVNLDHGQDHTSAVKKAQSMSQLSKYPNKWLFI